MTAYYNEIDPYAAQWLRNLIDDGHIADGEVDERSIADVAPSDLVGYTQCHFFAGIGGWSYALRLAGWSDDRPVWTGSCPCQPFSNAGAGAGFNDPRHLWPYWHHHIDQRRPPVVFGEQVEAAVRHGWLDLVQDDMEGIGYAFAAVGLPAACIGAPHIRQRLWFVADADGRDSCSEWQQRSGEQRLQPQGDGTGIVANNNNTGLERWSRTEERAVEFTTRESGVVDELVFSDSTGPSAGSPTTTGDGHRNPIVSTGWDDCEWLACMDGKSRPVEPGTFPLAHGVPGRVGRLRAYGNAIVPQVAAEVIRAYMVGSHVDP